MATKERRRELAPGIVEIDETELGADGHQPAIVTPGANAQSSRPSDEKLKRYGLRFDKEKGTYVNLDDGRPANIDLESWKALFGVTKNARPLVLPAR